MPPNPLQKGEYLDQTRLKLMTLKADLIIYEILLTC